MSGHRLVWSLRIAPDLTMAGAVFTRTFRGAYNVSGSLCAQQQRFPDSLAESQGTVVSRTFAELRVFFACSAWRVGLSIT